MYLIKYVATGVEEDDAALPRQPVRASRRSKGVIKIIL